MEPSKIQQQRKNAVWEAYQRPRADQVTSDEREVLQLLEKRKGAATVFELQARASASGETVEKALASLRRKNMIRLTQESRGHIIVRLAPLGRMALKTS